MKTCGVACWKKGNWELVYKNNGVIIYYGERLGTAIRVGAVGASVNQSVPAYRDHRPSGRIEHEGPHAMIALLKIRSLQLLEDLGSV